jgi:peroxiredoxin (alkyl hydroperoxide reductase subunit C)
MKTRLVLFFAMLLLVGNLVAENKKKTEIPLLGSVAPSFTAETTNGQLNFPADFGKNWKILFSHPQDFTPVCTSELMELARMQGKMDDLGVKMAVISTDTKERHLMWKQSMEETLSLGNQAHKIKFPLIDDHKATISNLYGMIHFPTSTTKDVRGVFIISPENIIETTLFYPTNIGRNMEEIVRTVQALQTAHASSLLTPVNWQPGGDLMVPYYPYTKEQLSENPQLADDYYQIGNHLWFKKTKKQ